MIGFVLALTATEVKPLFAATVNPFFMISLSIIMSFYFGGKGLAIALLFSEFISFIIHSILLNNENK